MFLLSCLFTSCSPPWLHEESEDFKNPNIQALPKTNSIRLSTGGRLGSGVLKALQVFSLARLSRCFIEMHNGELVKSQDQAPDGTLEAISPDPLPKEPHSESGFWPLYCFSISKANWTQLEPLLLL